MSYVWLQSIDESTAAAAAVPCLTDPGQQRCQQVVESACLLFRLKTSTSIRLSSRIFHGYFMCIWWMNEIWIRYESDMNDTWIMMKPLGINWNNYAESYTQSYTMLFTSISQVVPWYQELLASNVIGSWRPIISHRWADGPVLVRRGTEVAHGRLLYHWRQLTKAPWQREIFGKPLAATLVGAAEVVCRYWPQTYLS